MKAIEQHIKEQIQESGIKIQDRRCISFIKDMELKEEFVKGTSLFIQNEEQELKYNCLSTIQFCNLSIQQFHNFKIQFEIYILQRKDVDYIGICLI